MFGCSLTDLDGQLISGVQWDEELSFTPSPMPPAHQNNEQHGKEHVVSKMVREANRVMMDKEKGVPVALLEKSISDDEAGLAQSIIL